MSLLAWYFVLGAVQITLALWVILAHPRRRLNWAVGILLVLWAGSGIMFQMWREVGTFEGRRLFAGVGNIYQTPSYFLILLVIDALLLPTQRPRGWRTLLIASGLAVPFFWLIKDNGVDWYTNLPSTINASAEFVVQTAAVLLAARVANDASRSARERRQATLVGLAFALLLAYRGATEIGNAFWGAPWGDYVVDGRITYALVTKTNFTVLGAAGMVAALYLCARVPAVFRSGARAAIGGSVILTMLVGLVANASIVGFTILGGRTIVLSAFALVIAVAVFRYDLAAGDPDTRRRLQTLSAILLGLCAISIAAVAAWSLLPQGSVVLAVALSAVVVPVALVTTPLRRVPAWLTTRALLHPRDPEALRERVRVYASTLRAASGPDGRPLAAAEPALVALRRELGLSQRDHDLLVSMRGDEVASSLVAYRLALVAAASGSESMRKPELDALRDELGVSEREHAIVVEHIGASADSLSAGALFLGRYHILRRLSEGGMGEVWLAHDTREGVDVVLKRLAGQDRRDGAALKRFRSELRASALDHPHIVAVREVEMVGDDAFVVMEHMKGGSLADALRTRGRLPEPDVVAIANDVLDALDTLHANGFVHRDVKPANILIDENGVAKLGDFNVARELVSGDTLGAEGMRGPIGTFAYMPPEQARGLAARPQSDLYSLGATMYEAIAGAPLLELTGLSHTEAIARITRHEPPTEVPHASERVAAAIARALARLPEDRFRNAAQMRAAITPAGTREGSDPPR